MIGRYRVSLNGVEMDSLDEECLLILDVGYPVVDATPMTNRTANLDGYDYDTPYLEKRLVSVTFEIHAYDTAQRNALCQLVNNWAKAGGVLRTSDRAGQQLRNVRCEQFASIESSKNWTDPLTLVFSTTYNPHWQSEEVKTLTLAGTYATGSLSVDGNTSEALVNVNITANADVNSVQITVGNSTLKLTGLSLSNNGKLIIDYVNERYLRITQNGTSVMGKLNPSSSDVLSIPSGTTKNITITASGRITAVVTARGLWI